jgi:hypothetical protein
MANPLFLQLANGFTALFKRKEFIIMSALWAKWYFLVVPIAITVLYKIYTALNDSGKLDQFYQFVSNKLNEVQHITNQCAPLLVQSLQKFMDCM